MPNHEAQNGAVLGDCPWCYCPSSWDGDSIELDADESRHLQQALRLRSGDAVTLFNGLGRTAPARVASASRSAVAVALDGEAVAAPRPTRERWLFPVVPRGQKMDLILQKSAELGAARVLPLIGEHSVARIGDRVGHKMSRWQRILIEACKQSHNPWVPALDAPVSLLVRMADGPLPEMILFGDMSSDAVPLAEALTACGKAGAVGLLVGPEGDFSDAERSAMLAAGGRGVTLGPRRLRAETASFYMLSVSAAILEEA